MAGFRGSISGGMLALALMLGACGDGALGTPTPAVGAVCDRDPPLTYENFGRAFMTQNCTPCHHALLPEADRNGAPPGVDFETYAKVIAWAPRIEERTLVLETMPPGGGLAGPDLALFQEWLDCAVVADTEALTGEGVHAWVGEGGR